MSLFLAIDSGGTKTRCLLADETRELARASTGSVKLTRVGEAEATARLLAMLTEVSTAAGVGLSDVTHTCAGLGGFSIDAVREWGERVLADAVSGDLILCGDEDIALDGAFEGSQGILVIAGTGSKVAGRAVDGTIYNSGGWGHAIGDEGSGYWIGQEALRAGFWAKDRGIATDLLNDIAGYWGAATLGDLVGIANALPQPDFAALCPVVARCAEKGDELAVSVLERAGDELADLVALVALKMKESGETGKICVAYIGSVLEHISLVRASMVASLKRSTPEVAVMEGAVDGLLGALWRARNDAR
jgi:glucosamine kinase